VSTTYPSNIDNNITLPQIIDLVTPVAAESVNNLRQAILAIENELGIDPSSTYGTVRARLDAMEFGGGGGGSVGISLNSTLVVDAANNINFVGSVNVINSGGGIATIEILGSGEAEQETITVLSNGQTAFTLSQIPADTETVMMFLNGIKQEHGVDYTVSSVNVNYLGSIPIVTTDIVEFWYLLPSQESGPIILDGYVRGPAIANDNAVARFDGTTGKLIKNSNVLIDNTGLISSFGLNVAGNGSFTGNITVGGTVNGVLVAGHASRHQDGGADEINVTGLSGLLADAQRVTVRRNSGANISTRPRINFIEGSNVSLSISDDAGNNEVDIVINSLNTVDGYVYQTRTISTGSGLSGGGDLSQNRTISIQQGLLDGYVIGPSSSTDMAIARYDGYTGKLIQDSSVTVNDFGVLTASALNVTGNILINGTVDGIDISTIPSTYALQTRNIIAGTGLIGGGNLSSDRTISIQPGLLDGYAFKYNLDGYATTTYVNNQDNNLQAQINFIEDTLDGYTLSSRQIIAGAGLSGGGNFTTNRTLSIQSGLLDGYLSGVTVRRNTGANIGSQPRLNFIEGSNVSITVTNDIANNEIDLTFSSVGGGGGASQNLFQTLALGNATDGYDISFTDGSNITTDTDLAIQVNGVNAAVFGNNTNFDSASVGQVLSKGSSGQLEYRSVQSVLNLDGYARNTSLDGYVPTSRIITAGSGLSGGGNLTTNRTISLQPGLLDGYALDSTVNSLTNNLQSQINFVEDTLDGYARNTINISAGTGLTGGGNLTTSRTISIQPGFLDGYSKNTSLDGYVPTARTITAGIGLSGGGSLSSNRTISLQQGLLDGYATVTFVNTQDNTIRTALDGYALTSTVTSLTNNLQAQINFVEDRIDGYATKQDIDGYIEGITVRRNTGSNIGTQSRLNFIEGSNVSLTISNDPGNNEIDITISSSGSGGGGVGSLFQTLAVGNITDGYDISFTDGSNILTDSELSILVNGTNAATFGADTNFTSALVGQVLSKNSNNQLAYISLPSLPNLDGYVLQTRSINTGSGLVGGGNLSSDRTISLQAGLLDGYALTSTVTSLTNNLQSQINFIEDTLDGYVTNIDGYVLQIRQVNTGAGLVGGGDLSSNRTISLQPGLLDGYALTSYVNSQDNNLQLQINLIEDTIDGYATKQDIDGYIEGITVRRNTGSNIGTQPRLNFIEGSNVTISVSNDPINSELDITISSSGGGGGGSVGSLFQTLAVGNNTDGYDVNFTDGSNIVTDTELAIQVNGVNAAIFGADTDFDLALVGQVLSKNSNNQLEYISLPSFPSLDGYVRGPVSATNNAVPRFDLTTGKLIKNSGVTIDDSNNISGAGTINSVTIQTHASRHEAGGADEIDGYDVRLVYSPDNYNPPINNILGEHIAAIDNALANVTGALTPPTLLQDGYVAIADSGDLSYIGSQNDGYVLTWNGGTWEPDYVKKSFMVEFALTEDVDNTSVYFTSYRGSGGDMPANKRSGSVTGISDADSCSPYQVPFNATIKKAILTLKGAGVANGTVTYPVTYQTDLFEQTFTSESKLLDIDFSISNLFTVGTWTVGNTHYKGSVNLNLNVDEGTMLGLKFINGSGASLVGQTRNAFITLILEER
jgi:hypothetical protein